MGQGTPFYPGAFADLEKISRKLPAEPGYVDTIRIALARQFLQAAHEHGLPEPEVQSRGCEHVAMVWYDQGDWYTQVDLESPLAYVFAISKTPDLMVTGKSPHGQIPEALVKYLGQMEADSKARNASVCSGKVYEKAFLRLDSFANEQEDWDGYGGKPAAPETVEGVIAFLNAARGHALSEPSLVLSSSGAVSVVWNEIGGWYISVLIAGNRKHTYHVLKRGESSISAEVDGFELAPALIDHVRRIPASE